MRRAFSISLGIVTAIVVAAACNDKNDPGRAYMPDMYYSRAYETYSANPVFGDGQTNRTPVAGTVARGDELAFPIPMGRSPDTANYVRSKSVPNPLPPLSQSELKEAERLYLIQCAICHGTKLDGNGPLWKDGKGPFPAKPRALVKDPYSENMPDGQMFYSIAYGKNLMGSYASQLSTKQRWQIVHYIKTQQGKGGTPSADTAGRAQPQPAGVIQGGGMQGIATGDTTTKAKTGARQ